MTKDTETVHCWVYASERREGLYLYLRDPEGWESLPPPLRAAFGPARSVMELDLHSGRRLAREDVQTVIEALEQQGYYLQLPPSTEGEERHP